VDLIILLAVIKVFINSLNTLMQFVFNFNLKLAMEIRLESIRNFM